MKIIDDLKLDDRQIAGHYKVQLFNAKTNELEEEFEGKNSVADWVTSFLALRNGVQTLVRNATTTDSIDPNGIFGLFSTLELGFNDNDVNANNNRVMQQGHAVIVDKGNTSHLAPIENQPMDTIENDTRTCGITFDIGANSANDVPINSLMWRANGIASSVMVRNIRSTHSVSAVNSIPSLVYTFDFNPTTTTWVLEGSGVKCALLSFALAASPNNKTYKLIDLETGDTILDTTEDTGNDLAFNQSIYRNGIMALIGTSDNNSTTRKTVTYVIDINNKTYIKDTPSTTSTFSISTPDTILSNGDIIRFARVANVNNPSGVFEITRVNVFDAVTHIESFLFDDILKELPQVRIQAFNNWVTTWNSNVFRLVNIGNKVSLLLSSTAFNHLPNHPVQNIAYMFDWDSRKLIASIPSNLVSTTSLESASIYTIGLGWQSTVSTFNSSIANDLTNVTLATAVRPNNAKVAFAEFPEITKTSEQIMRVSYFLTMQGLEIDNIPTDTGLENESNFAFVIQGDSYQIALFGWEDPEFVVDWGDGTQSIVHPFDTRGLWHDYPHSGEWTITIRDYVSGHFSFGSYGDQLLEVLTPFPPSTTRTSFESCFFGCSNLRSIPDYLFANTPNATNFNGCLNSCTSLTVLPEHILSDNPNITSIIACFSGCQNLKNINIKLHPNVLANSNVLYMGMFRVDDPSYSHQGDAPRLWEGATESADGCFSNNTSLRNWEDIPESWR